MKKIFVFLIAIISICSHVFSQEPNSLLPNYLRNFQYQKALEFIDAQQPTKELLEQKAFCYKSLGLHQKAIEILLPLSEEYNEDIKIKSDLALCYDAVGKRKESIDCYDSLIRIDSTNVYFKTQKAELLFLQEKYTEALSMFQNIYKENGFLNCLRRSAQCLEKMNQSDSAIQYFSEVLEIDSMDKFSMANLINLQLKTKHYGNAMILSDVFLKRDSTDKQINLLNALSYYMADLYEESVTRFKKCYAAGDTSLVVNRSLGIALYSLKDSYDAQPFLESAYRQDTTNNNVIYCLAIVCNDMGEHKKSIPLFQKLLDRTVPPDLTLYLYYRNLALAYSKGSHFKESVDTYLNALKYADEDQMMAVNYAIAQIYDSFIKDKSKALEYYKYYKIGLTDYIERLRKKPDTEPREINQLGDKIKWLDKYIADLENGLGGK